MLFTRYHNIEIVCVTTCSHCYKVTKHVVIRPQLYKLMCDCFPLANGAITNVQGRSSPFTTNSIISFQLFGDSTGGPPTQTIGQGTELTSSTTAHSASPFLLLDPMIVVTRESTHFSLNVIASVTISWTQPFGGLTVDIYRVTLTTRTSPGMCADVCHTREETTTSTSIVIDCLEENSIYTVTVSAVNK